MQLAPRYGDDPIVTLDGDPAAVLGPTVRQRRRLAATLSAFSPEDWAHPSRCEGWSAADVIVHLDSTNAFWTFSITSGLQGKPTRFLATFDPVASPAELVANAPAVEPAELLARFVASTEALAATLESVAEDDWTRLAESPPGHVSISALAHHALWDSWVHERDILLPLGMTVAEEPDEVAACLRYAAALSPALAVSRGDRRTGVLAVATTEPSVEFTVSVDDRAEVRTGAAPADLRLVGDAVQLLEALSLRRPLDQLIPTEVSWMLEGLAVTFDSDRP